MAKLEALRAYLPGFTARFIQWIAKQADAGTLTKELAARFEAEPIALGEGEDAIGAVQMSTTSVCSGSRSPAITLPTISRWVTMP